MSAVDMRVDLSTLLQAVLSGNDQEIIAAARAYLQQEKSADVLIGRIGMIAAHGDPDGHPIASLGAAAMLSRLAYWIPAPIDTPESAKERTLPLFVQALKLAAPSVLKGNTTQENENYPHPFFPSELMESGKSLNDTIRDAVATNDSQLVERILLGLYGTGADYRTMQVRAYEAISNTFQRNGHPLIFAVRGFQLLDTVEWGKRAPNIIHWLAPHLPLRPNTDEPTWIKTVRTFGAQDNHDLKVIRTRLSTPKDNNALQLHDLILSDADTTRVCQGVYDALVTNEASSKAVAAVISLAAADILQRVSNDNAEQFVEVAHGLLFSAALQTIFQQVRDVEVLNLLYTAAAAINALHKTVPGESIAPTTTKTAISGGGGLLAITQLETLYRETNAGDLAAALATIQRYIQLNHDPRALFGTLGLAASFIDTTSDQGHALQIVQAASDAFLHWPRHLTAAAPEVFIRIALRAATTGKRDATIASLA